MSSNKQLSITLSGEMAERISAKVATGEYATESEVIEDGLSAWFRQGEALEEQVFEDWLNTVAKPAYEAMVADPSRGVPVETIRADLAKLRSERTKTQK